MNYEDYCDCVEMMFALCDISPYELHLIDVVLENCNNYIGEDNYDKNEVIEYILKNNYFSDAEVDFEVYAEVRDNLGLKEVG